METTLTGTAVPADNSTAAEWWGGRRRRYNLALAVAGFSAFACYVVALEVRCVSVSDVEITVFTMFFQGLGYLLAMGLANLCYQLGPALERLVSPSARHRYRVRAYRAGLTFSVSLPFLIPFAIVAFGCE